MVWLDEEPTGSERSVSEVKGAQQNHQEHFAIGMILYGNYTVRPGPPELKSLFRDFYFGLVGREPKVQSTSFCDWHDFVYILTYKQTAQPGGFFT